MSEIEVTHKKPAPQIDLKVVTGEKSLAPDDQQSEFIEKFRKSILDQKHEYPLPEAVIQLHQKGEKIPLLTKKSYSLWQGKQKSKKTTLLAICIAAYIRGTSPVEDIDFECTLPGAVLFFDTEQGESYAARTMRLILKIAGLETSPNLIYCDLREYSPLERMNIMEAGIKDTPGVKMVVVDGVVDLMVDFMDAGEGHACITHLVKLCSVYDIHVAGVLHQNKNDKNARAHVGTISSQKCEMEIATEVDPDDRTQSIVSCVNSRGLPFAPFAIRWDKGCLPMICQDWAPSGGQEKKTVRKVEDTRTIAASVFKPLAALSHTDAIRAIMTATFKSESTAKRFLTDLLGWEMVKKGDDGLYRLNISKDDVNDIL